MTAINPAWSITDLPRHEVGVYALDLAGLASQDIPLPASYCLPISVLKKIGQANQLTDQLTKLVTKTDPLNQYQVELNLKQARRLISRQHVPDEIATAILDFYEQKLAGDFIRLTASPTTALTAEFKRVNNIRGETNLFDSILKLWATNLSSHDFLQHKFFPIAIVIQHQTQPLAAGIAFTQNPNTGDKTELVILASWGAFDQEPMNRHHDFYQIDQRSGKIEKQLINPKKTYWQRHLDHLLVKKVSPKLQLSAVLSDSEVLSLTRLIKKIKLTQIDQLKINWQLVDGRFEITKIKSFYFQPTTLATTDQTLILVGQCLNPGVVTGQLKIINHLPDIKNFPTGRIAVVNQLDHDCLPLAELASAIICQGSITDQSLLAKIRNYQLPTILQAKYAFKRLTDHQSVLVDAGTGKVFQPSAPPASPVTKQTVLPILAAVNYPQELTSAQLAVISGLGMIRSDHFYISQGDHPLNLLKKNRAELKKLISKKITDFYYQFQADHHSPPTILYRSLNLTSQKLIQLAGKEQYEVKEENPFLGQRGGSKLISSPAILDFELETLANLNHQLDQPIGLLLPFVRTSYEWQQLNLYLQSRHTAQYNLPPIWMQLNTPENILNLDQYLLPNIAGLSIDLKTINALLHGFDPDHPELKNIYPPDNQLLIKLLTGLTNQLAARDQAPAVILNLGEFNQDLIEFAVKNNLAGITVRPELLIPVQQSVVQLEASLNYVHN